MLLLVCRISHPTRQHMAPAAFSKKPLDRRLPDEGVGNTTGELPINAGDSVGIGHQASRRAAKLAARVAILPFSDIVLELHLLHGGLSSSRLQRLLSACLPQFSSRGMINACYMVGSFISDAEKQCSGFLDWSEELSA